MPDWLIQIICVFIGAIIAGFYSRYAVRHQEKLRACADFRNAFIDEILFIQELIRENKTGDILKELNDARPKHRKALETLLPNLSFSEKNKIKEAYNNYYNPRNSNDSSEKVIRGLSFALYASDKDIVKSAIGREIDGRELALENLEKLINSAK